MQSPISGNKRCRIDRWSSADALSQIDKTIRLNNLVHLPATNLVLNLVSQVVAISATSRWILRTEWLVTTARGPYIPCSWCSRVTQLVWPLLRRHPRRLPCQRVLSFRPRSLPLPVVILPTCQVRNQLISLVSTRNNVCVRKLARAIDKIYRLRNNWGLFRQASVVFYFTDIFMEIIYMRSDLAFFHVWICQATVLLYIIPIDILDFEWNYLIWKIDKRNRLFWALMIHCPLCHFQRVSLFQQIHCARDLHSSEQQLWAFYLLFL